MVSAYVSAFEFVFNEALLVQWAMFLWYTLTPRWSKKTTILCFLPICLLAPTFAALFPSRSVVRMFSVPAIMIVAAFACYRSKPIRTFFCAFYPQLASVVCETLNLFIFPAVYQNNYDATQFWSNSKTVLLALFYLPVYSLMIWFAASCLGKTRYQLTVRQWLIFLFFPLSQTLMICFVYNTMFRITPTAAQLCLLAGILIVCIAADIALLRTISDAGRKAELEATNRMLEKQLNMQLSHYTALTSQYEANRRIRHDILHHVNTIQYLLANGQQQEATEYAGQFLAENQRSSQLGQCDTRSLMPSSMAVCRRRRRKGSPLRRASSYRSNCRSRTRIWSSCSAISWITPSRRAQRSKIQQSNWMPTSKRAIWSLRNPIPPRRKRRRTSSAAFRSWSAALGCIFWSRSQKNIRAAV